MRQLCFLLSLMLLASCSEADVTIEWHDGAVTSSLNGREADFTLEVDSAANVRLTCLRKEGDEPIICLKGKSSGSFTYKADIKSTIRLDGLTLEAGAGFTPINLKNKKRSVIYLAGNTISTLMDAPQVCDTVASKDCMRSHGKLTIAGDGELRLVSSHTGSKGLKCDKDFLLQSGKLTVTTTGMYLYEDTTHHFPMPPMGEGGPEGRPGFDGPMPDFDGGMMLPPPGGRPDGPRPDGFGPMGPPPFEGDSMMGPPPPPFERHFYKGTAKGIKVTGKAVIAGGELTITTTMPGAEGLEAKEGIDIESGIIRIEAYDDGISTNGPILVTGGDTYVKSLHNDGIDTNFGREGAYTQHAGRVEVVSQAGPPEEGLDTDWTPIVHDGGELIGNQELQNPPFRPE